MGNKKWIFFIVGGIFIVFIICIFLIPNTIRMRSNDAEVEYVYNGGCFFNASKNEYESSY